MRHEPAGECEWSERGSRTARSPLTAGMSCIRSGSSPMAARRSSAGRSSAATRTELEAPTQRLAAGPKLASVALVICLGPAEFDDARFDVFTALHLQSVRGGRCWTLSGGCKRRASPGTATEPALSRVRGPAQGGVWLSESPVPWMREMRVLVVVLESGA
jgi:hypothetical protein